MKSAKITCPHCYKEIRLSIEGATQRVRLGWGSVDWSLTTSEIAKQTHQSRANVSTARKKYAPETVGKVGNQRRDWESVDWSDDNNTIAAKLNAAPSYVSAMRGRFVRPKK